jgi:hypothetical protein
LEKIVGEMHVRWIAGPMAPAKQTPVDFRNARPPWAATLPVIDRTSAHPAGSSSRKPTAILGAVEGVANMRKACHRYSVNR